MRQLKITQSITNRESQSLDKYLHEIGKVDLITAEEEVILAQKIREGDQAALERLTKTNLRFVVSVAKQYQNQGLTLGDLINEGNLGLIKAAKRFAALIKPKLPSLIKSPRVKPWFWYCLATDTTKRRFVFVKRSNAAWSPSLIFCANITSSSAVIRSTLPIS